MVPACASLSAPPSLSMIRPYWLLTLRLPTAQVSKRYQSAPNSGRGRPNTSAAHENSKTHKPSYTNAATRGFSGFRGNFGFGMI